MFYKKTTINLFYNLAIKAFLSRQYKVCNERYFSSYAIYETIKILKRKKQKKLLSNFIFGRVENTVNFLKEVNREDLAISISAHFNHYDALNDFEVAIKKDPKNLFILVEMAELYYLTNNYSRFSLVIDKINENKATPYVAAKKLYLQSLAHLKEGDMFPVSQDGNKIIKIFTKNRAYVEEARTYIMLGMMYKACTIFDTAQFMFQTALEISTELNDKIGIIEAYGNLGMLMSAQERFDEADDFFDKALEASDNSKAEAHILNQKGLSNLLKRDMTKALEMLEASINISFNSNNTQGLAFSNEIISHVRYQQKLFDKSIEHAKEAEKLYEKLSNYSALLEAKYLQALSFFELKRYEEAETISRSILEMSKKETTSFHIANIYNLLGLIFTNTGDLGRAKSLFKESLKLEQKNERFDGAAMDYFNISIIESQEGLKEQALQSLDNALEFASMFGETNLSEIIRKRINNLS